MHRTRPNFHRITLFEAVSAKSSAEPVLEVLRLWREHTPYRSDEDWIFAIRTTTAELRTPTRSFSDVTSVP